MPDELEAVWKEVRSLRERLAHLETVGYGGSVPPGDADTVDGFHAAAVAAANKLLAMTANAKFPAHTVEGQLTIEGAVKTGWAGSDVITLNPNGWNTITHNKGTGSPIIFAINGHYSANQFTIVGVENVDANNFRFWADGGGASGARVNWVILGWD